MSLARGPRKPDGRRRSYKVVVAQRESVRDRQFLARSERSSGTANNEKSNHGAAHFDRRRRRLSAGGAALQLRKGGLRGGKPCQRRPRRRPAARSGSGSGVAGLGLARPIGNRALPPLAP